MLLFAAVAVAAVAAVAAELCAAAGAAAVAGGAAAAAHAGDGAACAKSHDLTAGLQSINSLVATQRKLHPADSIADFPKVAFGSKATDTGYLRRVGLPAVATAERTSRMGSFVPIGGSQHIPSDRSPPTQ